ncbi:PR domain zinc finger protein 14 [Hypsibius exemplaris]|uniref:PR domain zinc finger protein 14 n=1 Tax=Hypsibius exemplaris TaxID=2072580 RepID=A0A1W0XD27_HYPEX|nr:PR domain zinc finger protein 14 [Hypsibius exemplaris]
MNPALFHRAFPLLNMGSPSRSATSPPAMPRSIWPSPIGFPGLPTMWPHFPHWSQFPHFASHPMFSMTDLDHFLYGYMRRAEDPSRGMAMPPTQMGMNALRTGHNIIGTVATRGHRAESLSANLTEPSDLPKELAVSHKDVFGIPHFGVFAKSEIIKGTRYGPYRGKIVQANEIQSKDHCSSMWEVFDDGKLSHYIDGRTANGVAGWMSLVQTARSPPEQNLEVSQQDGEIYYQVTRDIAPNSELLVSYGNNYDGHFNATTVLPLIKKSKPNHHDKPREESKDPEALNGFSCERCGKMFTYKYYLDKHLKFTRCVDMGDRGFPCPICDRSFEKRDRLRIHILHVHEKYKPHVCAACGKAFSQSSSLNKHIRVHTGQRPYKCVHCAKTFTASSILRTHIRQHSGEKPFKCKFCGKSFASHAAHDSHVRRSHIASPSSARTTPNTTASTPAPASNGAEEDDDPEADDMDGDNGNGAAKTGLSRALEVSCIAPAQKTLIASREYHLRVRHEMADQHPYRNDPGDPDADEEPEDQDQVVFETPGKGSGQDRLSSAAENTYYLNSTGDPENAPCGFLCLRFPSLSRYATLNNFILLVTVLCCCQGMFYAFWISIITSIEKQYELSSSQIGFVTAVGELGRIACLPRPRVIAISAMLTVFAYILLDIPDLASPTSSSEDLMKNEVCQASSVQPLNETAISLTKCENGIPLIYGIAVIQDHFVRKDSSMYLGLHFVAKVLGPVFGFLLGAMSTAMMVSISPPGLNTFTDQDPRWLNIRAWHVTMGILLIGLLNFIAAMVMLLFPPEFPLVNNDPQAPKKPPTGNKLVLPGYRRPLSIRLVKEDVKKLLRNQMFLTRVATVVINVFVLSGLYVFLPKYLEAQFYVQPNAANIATAIAILLPTGCGILVGCFLYRYWDLKPKHTTMITMTASMIFFVGFLLLISFRCETRDMAGDRFPNGLVNIESKCNARCGCVDTVFNPVCDVSTMKNYFSACRAGCEPEPPTQHPANTSHPAPVNCLCASSTTLARIPAGFCKILCNKFWPFVFLLFLILFVCSIPTVGSVMLIYRTVPSDLMLMAHLFMALCVGIFALFPSPMVFGGMMDASCLLWSAQGCSGHGACLIHDNDDLAFRVSGTISGVKILGLLIEIFIFWKARKLEFEEVEPAIMWSPDAVRLAFTETVGR